MQTLLRLETASQEIKKSRFLAVCGPVDDEGSARAFISQHCDATANHNCWAYRIGQTYRFSDDGEPSGTAGKPILAALDGQGLDRVAVVVTRWFGGILLGSGGLMRAYGGTAALCLRAAEKRIVIATVEADITCSFAELPLVKARLTAIADVSIRDERFIDTGAVLTVLLPVDTADTAVAMVTDLTRGRAVIKLAD